MRKFYYTFALIVLIQVSFIAAQEKKCKNITECFGEAIQAMMDKIDKEKQNLMSFLQTEDRYINTKHAEIKKKFDDLEKDSNEINARAAVLEKRAKSLDERTKEIENKHADINKRHEDFKKEMGFISNLSVDQRWKRDNNMYFHGESIVYENIITELRRGRFKKVGNPRGWIDNRHHAGNKWHKRELLRVGYQHNGWNSGLSVNVPEGYNVLWIRCANHVWGRFYVQYNDNGRKSTGHYTCGHRTLNEISHDGGAPDSYHRIHMWLPIPVKKSGEHIIINAQHSDGWIGGIAFSKNPWGHARNSAVAYHWRVNGGSGCHWNTHSWNSDNLCQLNNRQRWELIVPVVENGKDKLLYIVEHNNSWLGTMHTSVTVSGKAIERFRTSYDNPFAIHYNSKWFDRYIAAFVPKELIPKGADFIKVVVDMSMQDHNIYLREIGTHDAN